MTKEALLALRKSTLLGVKSESQFSIKDVVRLKKLISEGLYEADYDYNNDDVNNQTDLNILCGILLGTVNADQYV